VASSLRLVRYLSRCSSAWHVFDSHTVVGEESQQGLSHLLDIPTPPPIVSVHKAMAYKVARCDAMQSNE